MWTPQNRKRYDRSQLRYPSDLTEEEWAHIAPLIPPATPGGNKHTWARAVTTSVAHRRYQEAPDHLMKAGQSKARFKGTRAMKSRFK